MSVVTYTSSDRAIDLPNDGYGFCCGLAPEVFTWRKHKLLIGIQCRNLNCTNHVGVLCYKDEAKEKWEKFRNDNTESNR